MANISERALKDLKSRNKLTLDGLIISDFPSYTFWLPAEERHADANTFQSKFISNEDIPKKIIAFSLDGELLALDALRVKIKDTYNWEWRIPQLNEIVEFNL